MTTVDVSTATVTITAHRTESPEGFTLVCLRERGGRVVESLVYDTAGGRERLSRVARTHKRLVVIETDAGAALAVDPETSAPSTPDADGVLGVSLKPYEIHGLKLAILEVFHYQNEHLRYVLEHHSRKVVALNPEAEGMVTRELRRWAAEGRPVTWDRKRGRVVMGHSIPKGQRPVITSADHSLALVGQPGPRGAITLSQSLNIDGDKWEPPPAPTRVTITRVSKAGDQMDLFGDVPPGPVDLRGIPREHRAEFIQRTVAAQVLDAMESAVWYSLWYAPFYQPTAVAYDPAGVMGQFVYSPVRVWRMLGRELPPGGRDYDAAVRKLDAILRKLRTIRLVFRYEGRDYTQPLVYPTPGRVTDPEAVPVELPDAGPSGGRRGGPRPEVIYQLHPGLARLSWDSGLYALVPERAFELISERHGELVFHLYRALVAQARMTRSLTVTRPVNTLLAEAGLWGSEMERKPSRVVERITGWMGKLQERGLVADWRLEADTIRAELVDVNTSPGGAIPGPPQLPEGKPNRDKRKRPAKGKRKR